MFKEEKEMKNETLLKDMPIHMERIENNYLLGETIKDSLNEITIESDIDELEDSIISDIVDVLEDAEFQIIDGKVSIDDKEGLAQLIFKELKNNLEGNEDKEITNMNETIQSLSEVIAEFVNHNYQFKGI